VDAHRNKILGDDFRDLCLRIDLGFQPSASGSIRRRAEIEQRQFSGSLRLAEAEVRIR
jgi:hypothetical protein